MYANEVERKENENFLEIKKSTTTYMLVSKVLLLSVLFLLYHKIFYFQTV